MDYSRFILMRFANVTLLLYAFAVCGCHVMQPQQVPADAVRAVEPGTGAGYVLYVPSYHNQNRQWPLVVTLHGTPGLDSAGAQINEWKVLAERHGFIVVAPELGSVRGIIPKARDAWLKDLQKDEQTILAVIDRLAAQYRVDPKAVLLTAFSQGGNPMYYTGLRNPSRFTALVARSANSDLEMLRSIPVTRELRDLPMFILWGRDDYRQVEDDSWAAYRHLRENRCFKTERETVAGGHLRRPEIAYQQWLRTLPAKYRN